MIFGIRKVFFLYLIFFFLIDEDRFCFFIMMFENLLLFIVNLFLLLVILFILEILVLEGVVNLRCILELLYGEFILFEERLWWNENFVV